MTSFDSVKLSDSGKLSNLVKKYGASDQSKAHNKVEEDSLPKGALFSTDTAKLTQEEALANLKKYQAQLDTNGVEGLQFEELEKAAKDNALPAEAKKAAAFLTGTEEGRAMFKTLDAKDGAENNTIDLKSPAQKRNVDKPEFPSEMVPKPQTESEEPELISEIGPNPKKVTQEAKDKQEEVAEMPPEEVLANLKKYQAQLDINQNNVITQAELVEMAASKKDSPASQTAAFLTKTRNGVALFAAIDKEDGTQDNAISRGKGGLDDITTPPRASTLGQKEGETGSSAVPIDELPEIRNGKQAATLLAGNQKVLADLVLFSGYTPDASSKFSKSALEALANGYGTFINESPEVRAAAQYYLDNEVAEKELDMLDVTRDHARSKHDDWYDIGAFDVLKNISLQ